MFAALLASVSLGGCGESSADKAMKEVCGARTEISKQIGQLQSLTLVAGALDKAKASLEVIGAELRKMKDAQSDLAPARKQQVETGTAAFEAELKSVTANVASMISSEGVQSSLETLGPKLESSVSALAASYEHALAPINCS